MDISVNHDTNPWSNRPEEVAKLLQVLDFTVDRDRALRQSKTQTHAVPDSNHISIFITPSPVVFTRVANTAYTDIAETDSAVEVRTRLTEDEVYGPNVAVGTKFKGNEKLLSLPSNSIIGSFSFLIEDLNRTILLADDSGFRERGNEIVGWVGDALLPKHSEIRPLIQQQGSALILNGETIAFAATAAYFDYTVDHYRALFTGYFAIGWEPENITSGYITISAGMQTYLTNETIEQYSESVAQRLSSLPEHIKTFTASALPEKPVGDGEEYEPGGKYEDYEK